MTSLESKILKMVYFYTDIKFYAYRSTSTENLIRLIHHYIIIIIIYIYIIYIDIITVSNNKNKLRIIMNLKLGYYLSIKDAT